MELGFIFERPKSFAMSSKKSFQAKQFLTVDHLPFTMYCIKQIFIIVLTFIVGYDWTVDLTVFWTALPQETGG